MINKDCCTNNSITNLCEIQNEEHLAEYLKEILGLSLFVVGNGRYR